jgi:hypothetical protein
LLVQITPIKNLSYERVTYYTVWVGERPLSEFRDFQERMAQKAEDLIELNEIRRFIKKIGEEYGAQQRYFKPEGAADRLPPPFHVIKTDGPNDYGVRLYCIRLSEGIVILLNGNRKTALKAKNCDNCRPHFQLANRIAQKITEAIQEGYIELNHEENVIEMDEDFDLHI